jgi:Tat protein secretion system quality control protein TatD with DNase activity
MGQVQVHETALEICQAILPVSHRIYIHSFFGNHRDTEAWLNAFPLTKFGYSPKLVAERTFWRSALQVLPTVEAFQQLETSQILVESDAPYQALFNQSSPHLVYEVAKDLAKILKLPLEHVVRCTSTNTICFYAQISLNPS